MACWEWQAGGFCKVSRAGPGRAAPPTVGASFLDLLSLEPQGLPHIGSQVQCLEVNESFALPVPVRAPSASVKKEVRIRGMARCRR